MANYGSLQAEATLSPSGMNAQGVGDLDAMLEGEQRPLVGLRRRRGVRGMFDAFRSAVKRVAPPHKEHFEVQQMYESLDYEEMENQVELAERQKSTKRQVFVHDVLRWIIMFFVGVLTAVIAFSIDMMIMYMANLKFGWIKQSIDAYV